MLIGHGIHPLLKREAKDWLLSQGCEAIDEELPVSGSGVDFLSGEHRNFRIDVFGCLGPDRLLGVECGMVSSFILPVYYYYHFLHMPIELYHLPNLVMEVGYPHPFGGCFNCTARGYWKKLAEIATAWNRKLEPLLPDI